MGWTDVSHFCSPSCPVENIGTHLDELPVKARSCSALAAYATLCSILLPLALHKKCEKVINKEHGAFDSFLQECALFSRVHSMFSFLLLEASYLTGFSPAFPLDLQTHHLFLADKLPGTSSTFLKCSSLFQVFKHCVNTIVLLFNCNVAFAF